MSSSLAPKAASLVRPCFLTAHHFVTVSVPLKATEWILSGIYVCGPRVNTSSQLPFAWDILTIVINALLFMLAVGRFVKHALDMRRMLNRWTVNDLMRVLVRDSILYFFLCVLVVQREGTVARGLTWTCRNLLATILLMISVWGIPDNVRPLLRFDYVFTDVFTLRAPSRPSLASSLRTRRTKRRCSFPAW